MNYKSLVVPNFFLSSYNKCHLFRFDGYMVNICVNMVNSLDLDYDKTVRVAEKPGILNKFYMLSSKISI